MASCRSPNSSTTSLRVSGRALLSRADGVLAERQRCAFRPCAGPGALSLLLVVNVLPRLTLFLLFALYLSLTYAGQVFRLPVGKPSLLEPGLPRS
jgi:hypothetical protein